MRFSSPIWIAALSWASLVLADATYKNAVYFAQWGVYGRNYHAQNLTGSELTHVIYAFADVKSDGTVFSTDTYADYDKHYSTDSWNDKGTNAYGSIKQLYLQKKANRNMKVLLSIGGWTYSQAGHFSAVANDSGRQTFASTAVKMMTDYGFDGIDIDWEYPSSSAEATNFSKLLQAVRSQLKKYKSDNGIQSDFLISVAAPAGPSHYQSLDIAGMKPNVDIWWLMSYDYAGSWDPTTGHQANVYKSSNLNATRFDTNGAVQHYKSAGIDTKKISLGLPLYGRRFQQTTGPGASYSGVGDGQYETGIWNYNKLPFTGAAEKYDDKLKAAWSYDSKAQEMFTYDTVKSTGAKMDWVKSQSLGGAFFWEASGDRTDDKSLVKTAMDKLGKLESKQNNLNYPTSRFDNIKNGMKGS